MNPEFEENWVIRVDDKDFCTNKEGKDKVLEAMREGKRFVAITDKDFISIRHISYIYLQSRRIKNQLEAPQKDIEITDEQRQNNFEKIKEIRERFPFLNKQID